MRAPWFNSHNAVDLLGHKKNYLSTDRRKASEGRGGRGSERISLRVCQRVGSRSQLKNDYTTNSHYLTYTFLFKKDGRMYFLNLGVKGLTDHSVSSCIPQTELKGWHSLRLLVLPMNKPLKKCLVRSILLVIYTLLGGVLFWKLEEKGLSNLEASERVLDELWREVNATGATWTKAQFDAFTHSAYQGVRLERKRSWNFMNGVFFVIVTLTTVGKSMFISRCGKRSTAN